MGEFSVSIEGSDLELVHRDEGSTADRFLLSSPETDVEVVFRPAGKRRVKQLLLLTNHTDSRSTRVVRLSQVVHGSMPRRGPHRMDFPLRSGGTLIYDYSDVSTEDHHVDVRRTDSGVLLTLTLRVELRAGETRILGPIFDLRDPASFLIRYSGESGIEGGFQTGLSMTTGDLDGNGSNDIVIGAPFADFNGDDSGSVYVILGGSGIATGTIDLSNPATYTARFDGARAGDQLGSSVGVGDVNGDTFGDLLLGAPGADFNARPDSGSVYVCFGTASFSSGLFNLWEAGSFDARFDGATAGDTLGRAVHAGEFTEDANDDLLMGAPLSDFNARADSGSVYAVFGAVTAGTFDLASGASYDIRYDGAVSGDEFGSSLSSGSLDGAAADDFIMGAPLADFNSRTNSGSAYVQLGSSGLATGNIDLSILANYNTRFDGANFGDRLGAASATLPFNNDARLEALLGAPDAGFNGRAQSGSVYMILGNVAYPSGNIDLSLPTNYQTRFDGPEAGALLGTSISGDLIDNGPRADALLGSPGTDFNGRTDAGSVFLVLGNNLPPIGAVDMASTGNFRARFDGAVAGDELGRGLVAGSINGGPRSDMLMGAPMSDAAAGSLFVVFGSTTPPNGIVDLATPANSDIRFDGSTSGGAMGGAIAVGDINNDTFDDLIIGAPNAGFNGRGNSGSVYVKLGSASPTTGDIDFDTITNYDLRIDGGGPGHRLGEFIAVGDINNDNFDDIIIGATGADLLGRIDCGAVYVIFGNAPLPAGPLDMNQPADFDIRYVGDSAGDGLGSGLSTGDVDNDAITDLVMGAAAAGRVYVKIGSGAIATGDQDLQLPANFDIRYDEAVAGDGLGSSSVVGDLNNDTVPDLVMGADRAGFNGRALSGSVYVRIGGSGDSGILSLAAGANYDTRFDGAVADNALGRSVAIGDLNNALAGDLIMGAVRADFNARTDSGSVYVVFGTGAFPTGNRDLSVPAEFDIRYDGAAAGDRLGQSLATGDSDNDTIPDLLAGAPFAGFNARPLSGSIYFKLGSAAIPTGTIDWGVPANSDDRFDGWQAEGRNGAAVAIGNFNGSGGGELILATPLARPEQAGTARTGLVHVNDKSGGASPNPPAGLGQFRTDLVTSIPVGGSTDELTIVFRGTISDPDPDTVQLQVEVRPLGAAFTGVPNGTSAGFVASGSTVDVTFPGLVSGTSYHWQARTADSTGSFSSWGSFGGNPENAADFTVNATLVALATMAQTNTSGTPLSVGAFTNETDVVFSAVVSSPTAATVKLQIEVQPVGTPFTFAFTSESLFVASGSLVTLTVPALADGISYHWQAQGEDFNGVQSGWSSFGANAESSPDFTIDVTTPAAPTLQIPVDGSTISNASVFFDWTDVIDPSSTRYELELDEDSGFTSPFVAMNIIASSYTLPVPLASNTYFWRVRTTDGAGNASAFTPVSTFTLNSVSLGSLTLSPGPLTPPDSFQLASAANAVMMQFTAEANQVEDVRLDAARFTATGTGNDFTDLTTTRLYRDEDSDGVLGTMDVLLASGSYDMDEGTVLLSGLNQLIPAGEVRSFLLVQSFAGSALPGTTFQSEILSTLDVQAFGVASGGSIQVVGPPLSSSILTIVSPGSPGELFAGVGPQSPAGHFVLTGETDVIVLQIVWAGTSVEPVDILQITLGAVGSLDDQASVLNVRLHRDTDGDGLFTAGVDPQIGLTGVFPSDNGTVTFFGLSETIPAGGSDKWLVVYDLAGSGMTGETFGTQFSADLDVVALGQTSASFVPVRGGLIRGPSHTVGAAGAAPPALVVRGLPYAPQFARPSSKNIIMLRARLQATAMETIRISAVTVKVSGSGTDVTGVARVAIAEDTNGDGRYVDIDDTIIATLNSPFSTENGTATLSSINALLAAGQTRDWLVLFDFHGLAIEGGEYLVSWNVSNGTLAEGIGSAIPAILDGGVLQGRSTVLGLFQGSSGNERGGTCSAGTTATGGVLSILILMMMALTNRRARSVLTLLIVFSGGASAFAQDEQQPVEESETVIQEPDWFEDPEEMAEGFNLFYPTTPRTLAPSPLRVHNRSLLHSLFHVAPVDEAAVIEPGLVAASLSEHFIASNFEETTADYVFRYDAALLMTELHVRVGLAESLEFNLSIEFGELLEEQGDIVLVRNGRTLIEPGDRSFGTGNLVLRGKYELAEPLEGGLLSVAIDLKVPIGLEDDDLLTSGGVDTSATLLYSHVVGDFTVHLNLGLLIPGSPDVFDESVKVREALTFGFSLVLRLSEDLAVVAQVQAHDSVFTSSTSESIAILDEFRSSGHLGIRFRLGSYQIDLSAGSGFGDQSADTSASLGIRLYF